MIKGARNRGVSIFEGVHGWCETVFFFLPSMLIHGRAVEDFLCHSVNGRQTISGVRTKTGVEISADFVVLCGGQWSRQMGAKAGVHVPLHSAEHFYIVY